MTQSQEVRDDLADLSISELADLHWEVVKDHYSSRPVPVRTFLEDSHFLGKYFRGDRSYFPFWLKEMEKVYPSEFYSPYYELIWDLPIGSGKTLSATTIMLYEIYRLSCLKDPNSFYSLADGIPIVFTIFSASLALSSDVNWEYFENLLTTSDYFINNCPLPAEGKLKSSMTVEFPKNIQLTFGSQSGHALGKAVFGGMLDEANFQRSASKQAQEGYLAIKRRRESRFLQAGGTLPGKLVLLSSPKLATDFLEAQKASAKRSRSTRIIQNTPIWEIRRGARKYVGTYSGKTFAVFAGNSNQDPYIVEEHPDKSASDPGLIVQVPVEHYDSFQGDLASSIRDIMGRPVSGAWAFITSPNKISRISTMRNRFTKDILTLDYYDQQDTIWKYADQDYFNNKLPFPEAYRFIHIDLSFKRDRAGIASVFATADHTQLEEAGGGVEALRKRDRMFYCEWVIYLAAKSDQEIPIFKVRDFIVHLKKKGYPILRVSADQFQSKDTLQQLEVIEKFETKTISVDRDRAPYVATRDLMYRGKLLQPNIPLLLKEWVELQDDTVKIDHPSDGSKDGTDAVSGAVWNCLSSPLIQRLDARFPAFSGQDLGKGKKASLVEEAFSRNTVEGLAQRLFLGGNIGNFDPNKTRLR